MSALAGAARRRRPGPLARREARSFYLFVSPWVVGFVLFGGGPIAASAVISLTDWSLLSSPSFVGLDNYVKLVEDPVFYTALGNTLYFAAASVGLGVVSTLALALLLNLPLRGIAVFRTIFYLPSVVSGIATALLWVNILHPDFGMINYLLGLAGVQGPGWLTSEEWAIPALVLMSVWGAGNTIVIYLAGLQGIPRSLYEAAMIDGAGWWRRLWHITVPMLSPVVFFNVVTGFIASLQAYVLVLVMTEGGPANATLLLGLYVYRQAFEYFDMGYAAALSWALFAIIIAVTLVQFRLARRWVHYEVA
ncbi:multiple sugar transport system permease protein [Thermocatellispora tengchongensis]|uniref:Multiple sugar transport system permease protein n=1 Tax=Thermocatellispora tengchongensis TaxID=1073253 RepID=A0A840PJ63_9ACTN|nr:sugar ABC transporter permease [Thermocatellispora tengchongensis]MBB5137953.1 multiple sugar transport system permease protein [Thermocatellispora tengchongensis]